MLNMDWWLILLVIGIPTAIIFLIVIVVLLTKSNHERGDYRDGGGKQFGNSSQTSFFMPASDVAGIQGERFTNYHLRPLLRNDEYLLTNLLIPLKNGRTTEIDSVIISRKGIFCIETKNWAGQIYGNDTDEYWDQIYDDPYKANRRPKNPVIQNERHCSVLDHIFHGHFTVEGAVIFVNDNAEYYVKSPSCYTIIDFKQYYRRLPETQLTIDEVKQVFEKLKRHLATQEQLDKHKERINKEYNN